MFPLDSGSFFIRKNYKKFTTPLLFFLLPQLEEVLFLQIFLQNFGEKEDHFFKPTMTFSLFASTYSDSHSKLINLHLLFLPIHLCLHILLFLLFYLLPFYLDKQKIPITLHPFLFHFHNLNFYSPRNNNNNNNNNNLLRINGWKNL